MTTQSKVRATHTPSSQPAVSSAHSPSSAHVHPSRPGSHDSPVDPVPAPPVDPDVRSAVVPPPVDASVPDSPDVDPSPVLPVSPAVDANPSWSKKQPPTPRRRHRPSQRRHTTPYQLVETVATSATRGTGIRLEELVQAFEPTALGVGRSTAIPRKEGG